MNRTLNDIHYMLAQIWIDKDGLGLNAFDEPFLKTLAERYGFSCESYEEAKNIQERVVADERGGRMSRRRFSTPNSEERILNKYKVEITMDNCHTYTLYNKEETN